MSRYKKGGYSGLSGNRWAGTILIVFGSVALLVALIMYGIGIQQLDTSYTSAATYSYMTGLTSVMGVFGLVIFLAFMTLGIGAVGAGAFMNIKGGMGGSWSDLVLLAVMGGVSLVITLIMFNVNLTQLAAAYTTTNATTNKAQFVGLLSTIGIFGIIIFVTMIGASIAQFAGAGFGAYRKIKGG